MPNVYKDEYKKVAPDPLHLLVMFNKCAKRMLDFKDISDDLLRSIKAPVLIVIGNADVMTPEHALQMYRLIPNSELAILPGGHGEYIGEIATLTPSHAERDYAVTMIENFLNK